MMSESLKVETVKELVGTLLKTAARRVLAAILGVGIIGGATAGGTYMLTHKDQPAPAQVKTAEEDLPTITSLSQGQLGKRYRMPFTAGSSLKTKTHLLLNEGKFPRHTGSVRVPAGTPGYDLVGIGQDTAVGRTFQVVGVMGSYSGKPQLNAESVK